MTSVLGLDSKEMTDVSELKGKWPRVREDFLFFPFHEVFIIHTYGGQTIVAFVATTKTKREKRSNDDVRRCRRMTRRGKPDQQQQ